MTLPSKIFIDGGDPEETQKADELLKKAGFHGLDGQTTNPTLIIKNAKLKMKSEKLTQKEAVDFYKETVTEMSRIIPDGSISIQVIGDPAILTTEDMLSQARERIGWIPNASIKFPATDAGIGAAEIFCQEGPINITLAFSQDQAAAVYAATKVHNYPVFISPFVGRLDDRGENGMDVVANIKEMYAALGDGHVEVLTASLRTLNHLYYALKLKSEIITVPFKIFTQWAEKGFDLPSAEYIYDPALDTGKPLAEIPYHELTLDEDWHTFDLAHDLTDKGLATFWEDWKAIVE